MKMYLFLRKINVILITLFFLFFLGCSSNRSKKKFFISGLISKNLTVEKYIVGSWGALSAETYSVYLTDSINFRVFVGIHGNEDNFTYTCIKDCVYVIRLSQIGVEKAKVIDTLKVYRLSELKRKKIFE